MKSQYVKEMGHNSINMKNLFANFISRKFVVGLLLLGGLSACGDSTDKFRKAMSAGSLSEAQEYLMEIDNKADCKQCALQLIKAYLEAGATDKAIYVYENITPWHRNRYDMKWSRGEYEREACKLLRTCLMENGEYEKALGYYPLDYENENYIGNAKSRYAYVSDVVAAICAKGKQDEARRWVEYELRWFVTNVDPDISTLQSSVDTKREFNSSVVRERLLEQIDNSY